MVVIGLHVIRIDAARGSVDDLLDARFDGFPENQAIEKKIRGRAGLMKIHVAAPAMVGGEMKHDFDALHRRARDAGLAQIGFDESDATALEMLLDVAEPAAGEVVHDAHLRAAFDKRVHQMRPDERSSAGYQNFLTIPDDALLFRSRRLLR